MFKKTVDSKIYEILDKDAIWYRKLIEVNFMVASDRKLSNFVINVFRRQWGGYHICGLIKLSAEMTVE